MNSTLWKLLTKLLVLRPAPGTPLDALRDFLRMQAALSILQDPSQAQIPPEVTDPVIIDAIQQGAALAAALLAANPRVLLRIEEEILPVGTAVSDQAERPAQVFGPFLNPDGLLVREQFFESSRFVSLLQAQGAGANEEVLLIPADSTATGPDRQTWILPAGSVWIKSRFLVAGTPNFAGVRIAGGKLQLASSPLDHNRIVVPAGTVWTLTVDLEQPVAGDAGGDDADALVLTLPTQFVVSSNAAAMLTGAATISGFGSDLNLNPAGGPSIRGNQIAMAMSAIESTWSIDNDRSKVVQFAGQVVPLNPVWAIAMSSVSTNRLGEAANGGSIAFLIDTGLTSMVTTQTGKAFIWFASTLSVNATTIEVQSVQPASEARFDFALWETSLTTVRFLNFPPAKLLFRSERGGFESFSAVGGGCTNQWSLPRRADGTPFGYSGSISSLALLANSSSFFLNLTAFPTPAVLVPPGQGLSGFALENLYLLVKPPGFLILNATFDAVPHAPNGSAILLFDVNEAIPTLPDPYAANLGQPDSDVLAQSALRVNLDWKDGTAPALDANLIAPVRLPQPIPSPFDNADDRELYDAFQGHLQSRNEALYLLDLSSREHLFGVAIEPPSNNQLELVDNRLAVQLNQVRLLMQPQVQWEAVQIEPNPNLFPPTVEEVAHSTANGGLTLVGTNSVKLVPVLAGGLAKEIVEAIQESSPAAGIFSLPFGLRAMVFLDHVEPIPDDPFPSGTDTAINEPVFGKLASAQQVRLLARHTELPEDDPSRSMPGFMRQLTNLQVNASKLTSVTPSDLLIPLNEAFKSLVPLHHADLSGYGLSTFSEWSQPFAPGKFTKVEFQVMNGRTAYEVIQFASLLYECGAPVVRTIILERHNAGRVFRIDTGWVATAAGEFNQPPLFQKGAVTRLSNIRRIRIVGNPIFLDGIHRVEPVVFDADAEIVGAIGGVVPVYDRPGYVDLVGSPPLDLLPLLFNKVKAISGNIDAAVRVGGTLEAQISSIVSDVALDDGGGLGFAVAIVGAPKLPRAGQWTVVGIDASTHESTPVDPRRGVPLVRNGADGFRFREPTDARRTVANVEYALMMATDTSRALFRQASIDPAVPGTLKFDLPPLLADPYSLVQATGAFPRPNFGIALNEIPSFNITPDNLWKIVSPNFTAATQPLADFVKGGGWGMTRDYQVGPITLNIDSANAAASFAVQIPPSLLNLNLPNPLGNILAIKTEYQNIAGEVPKLLNPSLLFQGALQELTETLDSLAHLLGLPFNFDVSVTSGGGAVPSFVVHMNLFFRLGDGPDGRIEIGIGKFYGQFTVRGELEAALTGVENALLFMEFQGDVQQGILPPLLYAGGLFRFSIELHESGAPTIQLTLGIVISIGGDLIPGLLAVEVTINYGYSLIPESLQPGILLGLAARAKLLGGLIGFSFGVEAMARILRKDHLTVTVFAQIRVTASIHVAIFFDEDIDFETQFNQDIPLAALGLLPGVGMAVVAGATVL